MDQNYYPDKRVLQESYAHLSLVYEAVLQELVRRLDRQMKKQGLSFSLKYRVKSFSSYYKKVLELIGKSQHRDKAPEIQDILGIRVVCPFLENLQGVENFFRSHFTLFEVERKGADHSFREFGYQSIHLLLEIPENVRKSFPDLDIGLCEVQIRTILQDAWSEVEHELVYKAGFTPYDESLRRKLAALNANLSLSDVIFQEIRDYQRSLHNELEKRRRTFVEKVEMEAGEITAPIDEETTQPDHPQISSYTNVDQLLLEALNAHNQGNFHRAVELYDSILERHIGGGVEAVITVHRGMALFAAARYAEALDNFLIAAELEPENNKVYYYLGIVYRVLDRTTEALAAFQRGLEIDPFHFESLFSLAQTFYKIGDLPAALEYCEKAIKIVPDDNTVMKFRAYVHKKITL